MNMKTTIVTALAALATAGSVQAQRFNPNPYDYIGLEPDNGFSVMLLGGMTVSNINTNDADLDDLGPKAGFQVGFRCEYLLPECYGVFVNGGLEYSMKGARGRFLTMVDDMNGIGTDRVVRTMYVTLPVHVGYRYDVMDNLGLYADFGPYFGIGTNGKHRLIFDNFASDLTAGVFNNDDNPIFPEIQRWDFGLGFRLGAEYARHYNFQFGCDWGITNMLTQEAKHLIYEANPQMNHNPALRNFNATLTFGYRF